MPASNLTAARLRELLHYDPDTGAFTRRVRTSSNAGIGDAAGSLDDDGYLRIFVDGHRYRAHRLAWLYMTGEWPSEEIDHLHGHRADNRWSELRDATRLFNQQNRRTSRRGSRSGYLGVTWSAKYGRWVARIRAAGRHRHLGYFDDPKAAHEAYVAAKRVMHAGNTL